MNIYSYDEGGYILAGEPVEAGPQPETYCFDLSAYGRGHDLRVELNMSQGSSLTVSETYFRSADLPNGWSSDGDPDGMPCLGYEEGGLIISYLGEEKVGLSHSPDVTAGCAHDICFTIAAVDGGGQFTVKNGEQTLDNTSISSPGEYCINLSSGSYSDLDLEWTTTSGSMTLTDVEIIETCDIFTQVADVKSGQGYYPGGFVLPGRVFQSSEAYRYGYQGSEQDDEITGITGAHITTQFRELDTRVLRWWSLDPKANASQSPYMSMGGNPLWFNDPLGDTIKINYIDEDGNSQTHTYSPGEGFTGNKYVDQSIDALNILNSGETGGEMIGSLHNAEETFSITPDFLDRGNMADASGVIWNPDNKSGGIDQTGNISRPAFIGLGHELAHVWDHHQGTIDQSTWYKNRTSTVSNAEKYATHIENKLRSENGIPLRTHYGLIGRDASGSYRGNPQSRIINSKGESLFFNSTSKIQILRTDGGLFDDGRDRTIYQGKSQRPYKY